ncbi:zf-HC2 domain-containing protein [Nocardioides panacisoli]|uniref:zf-HC2 domain-containing protein n=1 Tax=Nocardioides panacisoli TaxID=627624 RepID=UPI001C62C21E|nr:zf-HC2 domain-containing protein [Nocardioides panacisoli]QYJ04629.1 zf-HC2 domain-containing protein [Nocardioides panacisoli]
MAEENQIPCSSVREAISAIADDEAAPLSSDVVDRHLATCAACAAYRTRLTTLAAQVPAIPATDAPDLTARILAGGWPPETARARVLRWGLVAIAGGGLASTLWVLALELLHAGPDHAGHESAALTIALWAGFGLVAARPGLARPYLPLTALAVGGLMLAAAVDIIGGRVTWTEEVVHLNLVLAWLLAWLLAREVPSTAVLARPGSGPVWVPPPRGAEAR